MNAAIDPLPDGGAMLTLRGRRMRAYAMRRGDLILIAIGPYQFELIPLEVRSAHAAHGFAAPEVVAPMPGKVLEVLVKGRRPGRGLRKAATRDGSDEDGDHACGEGPRDRSQGPRGGGPDGRPWRRAD